MNRFSEKEGSELTLGDAELLVRQSHENVAVFDSQRISDALIRETGLSAEIAQQLALEVREQIERLGLRNLTSPLIRGLVNAKLIEYGLLDAYRAHSRLGVPAYDAARIIQSISGDSTLLQDPALLHGPEGTSLILAEAIKREYAMISVFSEDVSFAHLDGDLHIENLGEIDRPQTMIGSIDFIKRHGVKLPGGFAGSRPARRPEVLASHLVTYTAALQGYFSEAMTWDSVNYAFAPMLVGLNQREIRQLAQGLLFELSAPTIARGGQPIRCDLHLDWDAPHYIESLPMVGTAGEKFSSNYGSIGETARNFLRIFFEVYLEGDAEGMTFTGPRPILHLRQSFFDDPGHQQFLKLIERVMAERGGIVIAFDRNGSGESAFTSRYGVSAEKLQRAGENWQWRAAVFSSVGINLPRIGYRAEGNRKRVFELLTSLLQMAAQASLEKRIFLEKLLARGETGSLALLAMRPDQSPFLTLSWTTHAICPIGLAEMVNHVTGEPLAESLAAQEFALNIVKHLHDEVERLSTLHKVRFMVAESRDSGAARRLASLDRRNFGLAGIAVGGGDSSNGTTVAYTNGVKLPANTRLDPLTRMRIEGLLRNRQIWNGVIDLDSREHLADLITSAFHETTTPALTLG